MKFMAFLVAISMAAQTAVDLRTQSKSVDFTNATLTKPARAGSALPPACSPGEVFFNSSGPNLYICATANSWQALGGGGASGATTSIQTAALGALPSACSLGEVRFITDADLAGGGSFLYWCSAPNTWTQFGYVGGGSGALTSNCSFAPCTIDITAAVPLKAGANAWTGANDFSGASKFSIRTAAADPATCDAATRELYFNTASNSLKSCISTNTWTVAGGGSSFDPLDASTARWVDEFLNTNRSSSGMFGATNWQVFPITGTLSQNWLNGSNSHPGQINLVTGSTSGEGGSFHLSDTWDGAVQPIPNLGTGGAFTSWRRHVIWKSDSNSGVSTMAETHGFSDDATVYRSANFVQVRYDTAATTCSTGTNSTANLVYEVRSGGTSQCLDSGVAYAANTWYHLLMSCTTPGTVVFKLGVGGGALGNTGTFSTGVPTVAMNANHFIVTRTSSNRRTWIDLDSFEVQGLVR